MLEIKNKIEFSKNLKKFKNLAFDCSILIYFKK